MSGLLDRLATAWSLLVHAPDVAAILLAAGALAGVAAGWVGACSRLQRRIRRLEASIDSNTRRLDAAAAELAERRRAAIHAVGDRDRPERERVR